MWPDWTIFESSWPQKNSPKSSPNVFWVLGLFWKTSCFKYNQLLLIFGLLFISASGRTDRKVPIGAGADVTKVPIKILENNKKIKWNESKIFWMASSSQSVWRLCHCQILTNSAKRYFGSFWIWNEKFDTSLDLTLLESQKFSNFLYFLIWTAAVVEGAVDLVCLSLDLVWLNTQLAYHRINKKIDLGMELFSRRRWRLIGPSKKLLCLW